jgi:hypothetical protein
MCTIDYTQDALFAADIDETLKGKANAGDAVNRVEDCGSNFEALLTSLEDNLAESPFNCLLGNRILKMHFPSLEGSVLF